MNKASLVLGIAAAAALTGCMDPEWARKHNKPQVEPEPSPTYQENVAPRGPVTPVRPSPTATEVAAVPGDTPPVIEETTIPDAPGPDRTGARDRNLPPYPGTTPPPAANAQAPAADSTTYVVQPGDTLSKLSKRTNIKIDAIKKANPQIKGNNLIVGQKLTLRRENNKFDEKAIILYTADEKKLGYIPEKDNVIFSRLMDAGKLLSATIIGLKERIGDFRQISIRIYLMDF